MDAHARPHPTIKYTGTIRAGHSKLGNDDKLDIVSAFQSYGGFAAGLIDEKARVDIVRNSCPGPGACGGMYTANTMASSIEALGMALPYSSCTPAEDPMKVGGGNGKQRIEESKGNEFD